MNASASPVGDLRVVTGLFRDMQQAERAYQAAVALGYEKADINLVMSDDTRERLLNRAPRHAQMASNAAESAAKPAKGSELGGPAGGMIGIIAPVIAAVGSVAIIPGLVLAGPVAAALTAAGAVGLAGGLIGALADWGIPRERTRQYEAGVREGGILIGVKTRSAEHAQGLKREWQTNGGELIHG